MYRFTLPCTLLALAWGLVGCGDDDGDDGDDVIDMSTPDGGQPDFGPMPDSFIELPDQGPPDLGDDGGTPGGLDGFELEVATAQCAALFRCCDEDSIAEFFEQYTCFPGAPCSFMEQQEALPPTDMASCVAVNQALLGVIFGDALAATRGGEMTFDAAAYESCLGDLSSASCGADLEAVLYDGTCFAKDLPFPQTTEQVKHGFFDRLGTPGDDCTSLYEDKYGTCDPEQAFCCLGGDEDACTIGGLGGESGSCVAVSGDGEACGGFPDEQVCAPDLACQLDDGSGAPVGCFVPAAPTPLDEGDPCISDTFEELGECQDSWCDFETRTCLMLKADGVECGQDQECVSGFCAVMGTPPIVSRACGPRDFCTGT
ncbi:MAG: hypothetical protein CMN30_24920 [Sandaracinus sp.]|nr:hypothetical protein [Sandaracinus sp.]|tara:strand:+ start:633 stop:1745 length:1113 start_codon:yes stop_codon:yes gene_type:complete